jgi:hypothetical protein
MAAQPDATAITGSIPAAGAEARLPVIAGWTLLDIRPRNRALVQGSGDVVAVRRSSQVRGAGTAEDVTKVDGRWVVVTTQGIITPRA